MESVDPVEFGVWAETLCGAYETTCKNQRKGADRAVAATGARRSGQPHGYWGCSAESFVQPFAGGLGISEADAWFVRVGQRTLWHRADDGDATLSTESICAKPGSTEPNCIEPDCVEPGCAESGGETVSTFPQRRALLT